MFNKVGDFTFIFFSIYSAILMCGLLLGILGRGPVIKLCSDIPRNRLEIIIPYTVPTFTLGCYLSEPLPKETL